MTIRRMRFACWITKATDTHLKFVIFIAFLRQQWLRERTSVLRITYIISLIFLYYINARDIMSVEIADVSASL